MNSAWKPYKLGDVLKVKHGFAFKGEFFANSGKYIVLTPGNFYEKGGFKFTPGKEKYYSTEPLREYICSKGDLIVAMTEQSEGLLGSTAIVPSGDTFLHNQRIGLISHDTGKADRLFLRYLFSTTMVRRQIRGGSSGTKVKHTSPERIYDVDTYLPPLPVQKQIGRLLALLDEKINVNNRLNAHLEDVARLLFDYWFIQYNFPNVSGQPYEASNGALELNTFLGRDIPKGWEHGTADDLGTIVGGSTPSTKIKGNFATRGTPWITPNDLSENAGNKFITRGNQDVTDMGIRSASLRVYPAGTVLLSSRAPIGYMAIAREPVTTNQGFKSFIPNKGYPREYVYYAVKNILKTVVQYSSGSTFSEISGTVLKSVEICLPPKDLAKKFADEIKPIFDRQDFLEQENAQIEAARDWLLPMLMNGQVSLKSDLATVA